MRFDRNINGDMDVKFLECDYMLVQQWVKLTLGLGLLFKKVNDSKNKCLEAILSRISVERSCFDFNSAFC